MRNSGFRVWGPSVYASRIEVGHGWAQQRWTRSIIFGDHRIHAGICAARWPDQILWRRYRAAPPVLWMWFAAWWCSHLLQFITVWPLHPVPFLPFWCTATFFQSFGAAWNLRAISKQVKALQVLIWRRSWPRGSGQKATCQHTAWGGLAAATRSGLPNGPLRHLCCVQASVSGGSKKAPNWPWT